MNSAENVYYYFYYYFYFTSFVTPPWDNPENVANQMVAKEKALMQRSNIVLDTELYQVYPRIVHSIFVFVRDDTGECVRKWNEMFGEILGIDLTDTTVQKYHSGERDLDSFPIYTCGT